MPAAAVTPASKIYIKVVAIKKFVVNYFFKQNKKLDIKSISDRISNLSWKNARKNSKKNKIYRG